MKILRAPKASAHNPLVSIKRVSPFARIILSTSVYKRLVFFSPWLFVLLLGCLPKPKSKGYDPNRVYTRVVAASIFSAEVLWHLGAAVRQKTAAVPAMIEDLRYSSFSGFWPKSLPKFQRSGEEILAFQPDLVIIAAFSSLTFREMLKNAKIDFLALEEFNGFNAYRQNVKSIAEAVRAPQQGERLVRRFENGLAKLQAKARPLAHLRVLGYTYGNAMGAETTFHDALGAAGLKNLAALRGIRGFKHISVEQVLIWRPDIIVISCGKISCAQTAKRFPKTLGVKRLESRVLALPSRMLSSVGEGMLGLAEEIQNFALEPVSKYASSP